MRSGIRPLVDSCTRELHLAARVQTEPKGSVDAVVDFSNEAGAIVARASMRFGRQPHCSL